MNPKPYMNPYMAGALLGLLLVATIFISGRGLGASGAMKSAAVSTVETVAPEHASNAKFYTKYQADHPDGPLKNWLVFEVIGVVIGAFLSGLLSGRLALKLDRGPNATSRMRVSGALLGGLFFGFGAQLGRGCTSGAALSGMGVLSTGGIFTMLAIFGGAYAFAYFFRKLWL